jgi:hypothetical protein
MPDIDLDAIEALLAGRTPGDWELGDGWVYTNPIYDDDNRLTPIGHAARYSDPARQAAEWDRVQRDLELIAAAPTDLAALVGEVRTLRAVAEAAAVLTGAPDDPAWRKLSAALDAWRAGGGA